MVGGLRKSARASHSHLVRYMDGGVPQRVGTG